MKKTTNFEKLNWKEGLEVTLYCYIMGMCIVFYLMGLIGSIVYKMDITEWVLIGIVLIIMNIVYDFRFNIFYKIRCFINELTK